MLRVKLLSIILPLLLSFTFSPRGANPYWVDDNGAAANWAACQSATPLSGASACTLAQANANAAAGNVVYLRGGTYSITGVGASGLAPVNSGSCASSPCTGGTGATVITFSAYTGETPIIKQSAPTNYNQGLDLNGVNWVKVTGITFTNFTKMPLVMRGGASYNEVSYCQFTKEAGYEFEDRSVVGGGVTAPWSTHNWVHHNYMSTADYESGPCNESIDLLRVGMAQGDPNYSADNYNTVENNYLEYSAHANIVTYGKYNVIKNNIGHNEPWRTGCTTWQTSTSTTSAAVGTGLKSFTTQTGESYSAGQIIAAVNTDDYDNIMWGVVDSYNSGTGALVIKVLRTGGSGTYTAWIIVQGHIPYYTIPAYNGKLGHRVTCFGDSDLAHDNLNLIEGNRFGFGSTNANNGGADGIALESPHNLVRYNYVYANMASGFHMKNANGTAGTGGVHNYVYNNTAYSNGYGWNDWLYGALNNAFNGQGIGQYSVSGNSENVFKNNIAYGNTQGDICGIGWPNNSSCTSSSIDTVENNWTTNVNGDPKFADPDITDPLSQNLFSGVHGYATTALPNLSLQASSSAINGGTHLTHTVSGATNGNIMVVADAWYFQDGSRGSDLARGVTQFADWIAVGVISNTVQVSSIDYSTNTITLASHLTWADDDAVWLYKKSDGSIVLAGTAPDYGAYEYGASEYDINSDGSINWTDVSFLADVILGKETSAKGDVNGDGVKNVLDMMKLISVLLGR